MLCKLPIYKSLGLMYNQHVFIAKRKLNEGRLLRRGKMKSPRRLGQSFHAVFYSPATTRCVRQTDVEGANMSLP